MLAHPWDNPRSTHPSVPILLMLLLLLLLLLVVPCIVPAPRYTEPGGLPQELWVKVLQLVPQKHRLSSCPQVCHTWRDAAAAASSKVQFGYFSSSASSSAKFDSLMSWLSGRGQHVSTLSLSRAGTPAAPFHPGEQLACLTQLCEALQLSPQQVCYTGDDLPDLRAMSRCGLAIAPADAVPVVAGRAHWRTRRNGGEGAVREVCDLLLGARGLADAELAQWL